MKNKINYQFSSRMWQHPSPAGWFFVSLPAKLTKEIRNNLKWQEEGWGRLKVIACINSSEWKTSIWFDSKLSQYLLPIKAEIRQKENLKTAEDIKITLWI